MSLHDPEMPMNVEGRENGSVAEIIKQMKELLTGLEGIDLAPLDK